MIGQCVRCANYRPIGDPQMTSCRVRGMINRTFASSYHECFVDRTPKQIDFGDLDDGDFTGQAWSP